MANLLDYGAGASQGLDFEMEREFRRQVEARIAAAQIASQTEQTRHNMRAEDLSEQTILESGATRRAIAGQAEDNRLRDDARNAINMTPPGSRFSASDIGDFTRRGVPQQLFDIDEADPTFMGPQQQGGGTFKGTSQQQDADARIRQAEANAAQSREMGELRQGLNQEREDRLRGWGPPTVIIGDPSNPGGTRVITRDQLPQGGASGPPPAGVQTNVLGNETASAQLARLQQMFNEGGKDLVGPFEGRARSIGQQLPGVPVNQEFSDFEAATSAFTNSVIKAITGAQMSEPEARRIKQQIPLTSDKPEVWMSKAQQTAQNLRDLESMIARRQGGGGQPQAPGAPRRKRYDLNGNEIP